MTINVFRLKNCKNLSKNLKPTTNIALSLCDIENNKLNFVNVFSSKMTVIIIIIIIIIIIHEYYYGGVLALLLQDHLTMSVSRFAG